MVVFYVLELDSIVLRERNGDSFYYDREKKQITFTVDDSWVAETPILRKKDLIEFTLIYIGEF